MTHQMTHQIEVIEETEPTARRRRTCGLCGGAIPPETQYLRQRCTDGGGLWHFTAHKHCYRITLDFVGGWGELGEDEWEAAIDRLSPSELWAYLEGAPAPVQDAAWRIYLARGGPGWRLTRVGWGTQ